MYPYVYPDTILEEICFMYERFKDTFVHKFHIDDVITSERLS